MIVRYGLKLLVKGGEFMINKNLENINEDNLITLIENETLEGKTLDYKESFSGNSDADKKEFLADISSFANSGGGDIIYGIREQKGIPMELVGLDISKEDIDKKILWVDDLVRQGIKPRISGIKPKAIELKNGKYAIIIRIPKSWRSPHCVTLKDSFKFYARSSNGKYQLDVEELRSAFNFTETIERKIKEFKEERIAKIVADEGQIKQGDGAKIILHIIPLSALNNGSKYDVKLLYNRITNGKGIFPIYNSGYDYRINFDGINVFSRVDEKGKCDSYVQVYTNGIIEAVNTSLLESEDKLIPSLAYEAELIKSIKIYLDHIKDIGVEFPYFVFITLANIKGYKMITGNSWYRNSKSIDREILMASDIMVEESTVNIENKLKPIFDSIWNACGCVESMNYSKDGIFDPHKQYPF